MAQPVNPVSGWQKLLTVVRTSFSSGLNEELSGVEVEGAPVVIGQGNSLAYALATNDDNPAYYKKTGAVVPPLFASRVFKDTLESLILYPGLGLSVLKMVHAEQVFTFHKPLRVGMEVIPMARIGAFRKVSSGQIVEFEVTLLEQGEPIVSGMASMFQRTGKGKGGKKKASGKSVIDFKEVTTFSISPDQPKRYALASRDYNPIHTKPLVAKLAGFPRPIAHGLCVLAVTTSLLTKEYADNDPARLAMVKVRFSKPALPGQELSLQAAPSDRGHTFQLLNPKGKPVLSMGEVKFRE
jgi:acyl dehydratase